MPESLLQELQERIRSTGPMPFVDYMQLALYHPRHGYYTTRVPGHGVDYATAPTITPWFGRLVRRELHRMWEALGQPDPFIIVEVGGGLADIAGAAMEEPGWLAGALRWRFIERSGRVQELQRKRLGTAAELAQWAPALDTSPPVVGCVLANEVLDNFPFHRLQLDRHGEVREVYVDLEGECLVERLGPLSAGELVDTARQAAPRLQEGDRFEVCLELEGWCRQASQALERGYLLIVDYGDVEPDIWLQGRAGSLKTYGPGGMGQDPLREPGRQDITADVNLSALARAVEAAGFQPQPLTTQRAWLLSLGLGRVAPRRIRGRPGGVAGAGRGDPGRIEPGPQARRRGRAGGPVGVPGGEGGPAASGWGRQRRIAQLEVGDRALYARALSDGGPLRRAGGLRPRSGGATPPIEAVSTPRSASPAGRR